MGIPPSNQDDPACAAWRSGACANGKIVEHWGVVDVSDVLEKAGLIPPVVARQARAGRELLERVVDDLVVRHRRAARDERIESFADQRTNPVEGLVARVRAGEQVVAHVGQRAISQDAEEHHRDVGTTGAHERENAPVQHRGELRAHSFVASDNAAR